MDVVRAVNTNLSNDSKSIQTVIILDESVSVAKVTWRFTKQIIPLMLSKLSYEKAQLVHLLTFGADETPVAQKLQSLLQTLDANKRVEILLLTNEKVQDHKEIEIFAENLLKFPDGAHFSADDFKVVRLASECRQSTLQINNDPTAQYKLFDIDATESNEFIASRIAELFRSYAFPMHEQLHRNGRQFLKIRGHLTVMVPEFAGDDLRNLDYVVRAEFRPEAQEMQTKRRDKKPERLHNVFGTILVVILLFFLLFSLFHIYNFYVIFTSFIE